MFIYPDGSVYEGMWRKNMKHGKGRYTYSNGDTYCGGWYNGQRHGVGVYSRGILSETPSCGVIRFKGAWRHGVRVGAFEMTFGIEEKFTCMHGNWDNYFPQGPVVFNFDNRYLLMGYFQTPGRTMESKRKNGERYEINEGEEEAEQNDKEQDVWLDEPSLWYAQDICAYDYSLLPQEPVPLPLSDSEVSVCSIITETSEATIEKIPSVVGEGEEGEMEQETCLCENELTVSEECRSEIVCPPQRNPCAIEIIDQPKC